MIEVVHELARTSGRGSVSLGADLQLQEEVHADAMGSAESKNKVGARRRVAEWGETRTGWDQALEPPRWRHPAIEGRCFLVESLQHSAWNGTRVASVCSSRVKQHRLPVR